MRRFLPLLAVAAAALAFAFWWYSAAQVLKRRSDKLLELMTVEQNSGPRQIGGLALGTLLSAEVTLAAEEIPEANGTFANAELEAAWSTYQRQVKRASFERRGLPRTVISGPTATVAMTVETLVETDGMRIMQGAQNIVFRWAENAEGDWRLTAAELRSVSAGINPKKR